MQILMKCGSKGIPILFGNVLEACVTEYEKSLKVVITTDKGVTDFVPRCKNYYEDLLEQCYMCVEFLAQEIEIGTPLVRIDERGTFCRGKEGSIYMEEPLPF